ncbi:hypothetical protein ONZ45_g5488 [Pleurotus djamor]|nr:hypothetical protein ONZ45_g5488 [Pleurotus djamor]
MRSYGTIDRPENLRTPEEQYNADDALTESQCLLRDELEGKPTTTTPLPIKQLSVLCLLRVLDPLAFTQIFPYINNFMQDLHLTDDPSQVGFYSGLVESVFALAQLLAIYPWAYASGTTDKPTLYTSYIDGKFMQIFSVDDQ